MTQIILTTLDNPVYIEDFPHGKIDLQELKIWPDWTHPKFDTILTYKIGNDDYALKVNMNKKYTFDILAQDISDALNLNNEQVVNLYHNNGRITWRVFPPSISKKSNLEEQIKVVQHEFKNAQDPQEKQELKARLKELEQKHKVTSKMSSGMVSWLKPSNIKLSYNIIKLFKLENVQPDKHGIMTGEPVDKSSISFCFSNAFTIFFTCDECDQTTLVNNQKTKAIVAMPAVTAMDGSITASLPASLTFSDNYSNQLNFHIQDEHGNDLVVRRVFCRLTINSTTNELIINERLHRKNIP